MQIINKIYSLIGADYVAYIVMLSANTGWTIGLLFGAESLYGTVFYIGMVRAVFTIPFCFILARIYKHSLDFKDFNDFKIATVRAVICAIQQIATSFGFIYIPAPLVYTITSIGPIIVFVIDYFFNGVLVTKRQIFGVFVALFGLLMSVNSLIILQWFGYQSFANNSKYNYHNSSITFKVLVCVFLFVVYIMWAFAMISTKKLKHTSPIQLNYISGIVFGLVGCVGYIFFPNARTITISQLLYDIVFIGGFLSISTICYMAGLYLSKNTGNLTITNFSTVILGYIISFVRYGQPPNGIGILGSILMFIGLFLVLIKKNEIKQ